MTEDEAFDRLREFIVAIDAEAHVLNPTHVSLVDVLLQPTGGTRLVGPYAGITALGTRDTGEGEQICYGTATVDGVERVTELHTRPVEHGFRIDVYASRATDYLRLIRAALLSSRGRLDFLPGVVRDVSPATAGPALNEGKWEGRANLTVTIGALATETILIDVIESGTIAFESEGIPSIANTIDYAKG